MTYLRTYSHEEGFEAFKARYQELTRQLNFIEFVVNPHSQEELDQSYDLIVLAGHGVPFSRNRYTNLAKAEQLRQEIKYLLQEYTYFDSRY